MDHRDKVSNMHVHNLILPSYKVNYMVPYYKVVDDMVWYMYVVCMVVESHMAFHMIHFLCDTVLQNVTKYNEKMSIVKCMYCILMYYTYFMTTKAQFFSKSYTRRTFFFIVTNMSGRMTTCVFTGTR